MTPLWILSEYADKPCGFIYNSRNLVSIHSLAADPIITDCAAKLSKEIKSAKYSAKKILKHVVKHKINQTMKQNHIEAIALIIIYALIFSIPLLL